VFLVANVLKDAVTDSVADQIIQVINSLCEKFGIAVDWTAQNVLPYLQQLAMKLVAYKLWIAIVWLGVAIVPILVIFGTMISVHKAKKTEYGKRTAWQDYMCHGYQWWIYPTHNAYAALGRGGQTIFVAPEQDLIVVTTADLPGGHDPIFALIDRFILPAVIE
jgi:hypothetical protein